ncbi:MAG: serine/threonine-protein kinase [Rhodothermales bacterium]
MPPSLDWSALDTALDRALDLEGEERAAFLASLDAATRVALEPLLRDALADDPLLDHPDSVLNMLADDEADTSLEEGERVGPYLLTGLVGEGGMGRVFRAHRADGVFDQTVAVKVVRASLTLAGTDVAARLRRERAVLATLDHPGIARLLDGGQTDDGVPYLVTEFVDGAPITTWAAERALDVKACVRLLIEVARAIDHAHRRFVVHRDLKPSNVLVTERDGTPRPVVLDFGIAKLLAEAEDEDAHGFPLTRTGMRLMTPAYAAPELFEPAATVTTAADVYGLGALLYELLSGRRPHDDAGTSGPPTTEATRPSKAVLLPATTTGLDTSHRARALQGDLDTICLKALHRDPTRRYASASALADDLTRFLDGRPVEARPDSVWYVAGRFARRHRATVLAATVALFALVSGLGFSLVALGSEREARAEAEASAARADAAAQLLGGFFAAADPEPLRGRPLTAREALDQGVARVGEVESDVLRAYLLRILGETYVQIGDPVLADSLLQASLGLQGERATGEEVTHTRLLLAATRDALDDPETALALGERVVQDHQNDPDPDLAAWGLWVVARARIRLGQFDLALQTAERAERQTRRGAKAERRASILRLLGETYTEAGRPQEALPILEKAFALSRDEHGLESVPTASARLLLAKAKMGVGAFREAEALLRESQAYQVRVFGSETVGYVLANIAEARFGAGDYWGAAAVLDSAVTMMEPRLPPNHRDIGGWLTRQATALHRVGAYREAEGAARRAVRIAEAQTGHPVELGESLRQLGLALSEQGRSSEAGPVLRRALAAFESPEAQAALDAEEVEAVRTALAALTEE